MTSSIVPATERASSSSSNPAVSNVRRMPSARSMRLSAGRSVCICGSPPENTTQRTPSARIDSRCGSRSRAVISRACRMRQMSHITQRQLQRLWGNSTSTGSAQMRCGCARGSGAAPDAGIALGPLIV